MTEQLGPEPNGRQNMQPHPWRRWAYIGATAPLAIGTGYFAAVGIHDTFPGNGTSSASARPMGVGQPSSQGEVVSPKGPYDVNCTSYAQSPNIVDLGKSPLSSVTRFFNASLITPVFFLMNRDNSSNKVQVPKTDGKTVTIGGNNKGYIVIDEAPSEVKVTDGVEAECVPKSSSTITDEKDNRINDFLNHNLGPIEVVTINPDGTISKPAYYSTYQQ
jgi:hypothetical protein